MKILIDASQIPRNKGGVGTYAVQLIRSLAAHATEHFYYLLLQSDEDAFNDLPVHRVRRIQVPSRIFRRLLFRSGLEQLYIPYLVYKHGIEAVHSLHYSFPLMPISAGRVVTVHDLTFFKFPEWHTPFKRWYFKIFTRLTASLADRIIAISESTARDLIERTGIPRKRIAVIHLGRPEIQDSLFCPEVVRDFKRRHGISGEYILFVGTLEPRKNIAGLLRAFDRLQKIYPCLHLVIAGGKGWAYEGLFNQVRESRLEDRVVFTGFIDETTKFNLMREAHVFVYPSFYEGFGIPVLEAITLGVPTITSNRSALTEVAGDAALLVDPHNSDELFQSMRRLVEDKALRESLIQKASRHAPAFGWPISARQTAAIYESLTCRNNQNGGG
jgi:glycosyltransferase involved in cell wall biosynthesis